MRMKCKQTAFIQICLLHFHANSSRLARDTTMLHVRRPSLPSEAYDPGGRAEAELKGDAPDTAADTAGILVRAVAVAAALTSTSLRERWRELGLGAAAGVRVWAALAGQRRNIQIGVSF